MERALGPSVPRRDDTSWCPLEKLVKSGLSKMIKVKGLDHGIVLILF